MFGLEWSKNNNINEIANYRYDNTVTKHVTKIAPLVWGEHCLECAVPECYKTCNKFEARRDGRCQRFVNGIEKVKDSDGLFGYTVKISYKEWGKLETVFIPYVIPAKKLFKKNSFFDKSTNIAKHLPTKYPRRLLYLYREFVARRSENKKGNYPEIFLLELINPNKDFTLILETKTDATVKSRFNFIVKNGFNRFVVPFSKMFYETGKRNYISLFPENDNKIDLFICTADLVSLDTEYSKLVVLPKIKCVVWDLDNTLWNGILSEGDNVTLKDEAVSLIKNLDKRGILNSIASKNDYEPTYEKLKAFGVADYFLCPQINWGPKSGNVERISKILDLGLDTFAFVDDMAYERGEVSRALPFVRTFDGNDLPSLLNSPDVDVPITEASINRRQSYIEIAKRNSDQADYNGKVEDFIKSCKILVDIKTPTKDEYVRCNELIQRSNQLNLSGVKLPMEDFLRIVEDKDYVVQRIRVKDKYGDYGLVGVAIFKKETNKRICLEHFVMSCRAARKLIEQSYFETIVAFFRKKGFDELLIKCTVTAKNELIRLSLVDVFGENQKTGNGISYIVNVPLSNLKLKYKGLMEFFIS